MGFCASVSWDLGCAFTVGPLGLVEVQLCMYRCMRMLSIAVQVFCGYRILASGQVSGAWYRVFSLNIVGCRLRDH